MSKSLLAEARAKRARAAEKVPDIVAPPYEDGEKEQVDEAEVAARAVDSFNPLANVKGKVEEEVLPPEPDDVGEPLDEDEATLMAEADPEDEDVEEEEPEDPDDGMVEPEDEARELPALKKLMSEPTVLENVDVHSIGLHVGAAPEHGVHPIPREGRVKLAMRLPERPLPETMAAVECTLCGRTGTAGVEFVESPCSFTDGCQGILASVTTVVPTTPMLPPDLEAPAEELIEAQLVEARTMSRVRRLTRHFLRHREVAPSPYDETVQDYEVEELAKEAADPGLDPVDAALWIGAGVVLPLWAGIALQAAYWYEIPLFLLLAVWSATQAASIWVRGDIARHCRELWIAWRWDRASGRIKRRAEKRAEKRWMR